MNKGQLFEQSESLADSRLFSDLAKSNVVLDIANKIGQPVMKAVSKGAPKRYARWKSDRSKPTGSDKASKVTQMQLKHLKYGRGKSSKSDIRSNTPEGTNNE